MACVNETNDDRIDDDEDSDSLVVKATRGVVQDLFFEEHFPGKISIGCATQVLGKADSAMSDKEEVQLRNLAWRVLKGILAYDRRARDTGATTEQQLTHDDFFEEFCDEDCSSKQNDLLNPMDILQTCFLCCDAEVQQLLCKALFSCKLAFPFIYYDGFGQLTLSQWSLRSIVVEYRDSNDQLVETGLVSDHQFPIVCFARVGEEVSLSKSKLLNNLLGNTGSGTFFHRDLVNGDVKRRCTNGLVEATVLLPSAGQSSNSFSRPFILANIRGNMLKFERQIDVLTKIAQVIVLLIEVDEFVSDSDAMKQAMDKVIRSLRVVIVLCKTFGKTVEKDSLRQKMMMLKERRVTFIAGYSVGIGTARPRNEARLNDRIMQKLCDLLQGIPGIKLDSLQSRTDGVSDERDLVVADCKKAAKSISDHLNTDDLPAFKKCQLPLQIGWLKYSKLTKVEHSSKTKEENLPAIQQEKMRIREEQVHQACDMPSSFLQDFVRLACQTSDDGLRLRLSMQWLRLALDELSHKTIPDLYRRRDHLRDKVRQHLHAAIESGNSVDQDSREKDISDLQILEEKIRDSSIGLENLCRELGQMFEVTSELRCSLPFFADSSALTKIFAQLLLSGLPLEILDGNASNIPLTWVTSVLNECHKLVGDKIFVISVLGLQSSGKSTLLNTMFGLRLAVSAGRCTQGIFLQLVPVESGHTPFQYIAVIDTEGLRAPELEYGDHHHDNELATLVIGLGDLTVINVKGEYSPEMKDTLEIVVQAFVRMKRTHIRQNNGRRCVFVHHNVSAVSARERMMEASSKMVQDLDDTAKQAAEQETLVGVRCFSDIVCFEKDEDIFYTPDLWLGEPPMAPVNPGYSKKVRNIKDHILDTKITTFLTFRDLALRIKDMWTAVMSEEFVFSFRNSIEMKAYNQLDSTFYAIKQTCDSELCEWLYDEAEVQVKRCCSEPDIESVKATLLTDLEKLTRDLEEQVMGRLQNFFDDNSYGEYIAQWKSSKLNSLTEYISCQYMETKQILRRFCEVRIMDARYESRQSSWERKCLIEAKQIAEGLPMGCSTGVLNEKFDALWIRFSHSEDLLIDRSEVASSEHVTKVIKAALQNRYEKEKPLLEKYLKLVQFGVECQSVCCEITHMQLFGNDSNAMFYLPAENEDLGVTFGKDSNQPSRRSDDKAKNLVLAMCNKIVNYVNSRVKEEASQKNRYFEESDVRDVQSLVKNRLQEESASLGKVRTSTPLEIKLVIFALQFSYPHFLQFDSKFRESYNLRAKAERMKECFRTIFVNVAQKQSSAKISADFCTAHVAKIARVAIEQRVGGRVRAELIRYFRHGKLSLISKMLKDQLDRKNFQEILDYIIKPRVAALDYLKKFAPSFLASKRQESEDRTIFAQIAGLLTDKVFKAVARAAKQAQRNASGCLKTWIQLFCNAAPVAVVPGDLENILCGDCLPITPNIPLDDFVTSFVCSIQRASEDTEKQFTELDCQALAERTQRLCGAVLNKIWGCPAQCPFCMEPCRRGEPGHFEKDATPHVCIQHRPRAVCGTVNTDTRQLIFSTCGFNVCKKFTFDSQLCRLHGKTTLQGGCSGDHKFKHYKRCFPDWDIEPDGCNSSSKYWMWFCWTFREQLQAHYKWHRTDDMPAWWESVSEANALDSLRILEPDLHPEE